MFDRFDAATRLPAQDLDRARAFYAEKLGLTPVEERPGGLLYQCGNTKFALFGSSGRPSGEHTQMGWTVDDIEAVVDELRRRGVRFEQVDVPGLRTVGDIADVQGNYPSLGTGERAAWFRDSEGNLLGIGQPVRLPGI
ncbi:MAG: VOC family protein [Actinophytocola sp.]|uniref:VOC family protein n=1 Tax=Actinophytocola sp. TaxID=1872138 RepID=UPI003C73B90C